MSLWENCDQIYVAIVINWKWINQIITRSVFEKGQDRLYWMYISACDTITWNVTSWNVEIRHPDHIELGRSSQVDRDGISIHGGVQFIVDLCACGRWRYIDWDGCPDSVAILVQESVDNFGRPDNTERHFIDERNHRWSDRQGQFDWIFLWIGVSDEATTDGSTERIRSVIVVGGGCQWQNTNVCVSFRHLYRTFWKKATMNHTYFKTIVACSHLLAWFLWYPWSLEHLQYFRLSIIHGMSMTSFLVCP